jgi:methylenetetrahydrofolate reductase (NADPH)
MTIDKKIYSFELFPTKTSQGSEKLQRTIQTLGAYQPQFFSVTFGAGGSTQDGTLEVVGNIQNNTAFDAAPHLSCIGSQKTKIRELLQQYQNLGIRRLVALRGDLPSGMQEPGDFLHANELVQFIREETADHFHIEVAAYPECHPQAKNADTDLAHFIRKVQAGADSAITQYFYNAEAYLYFVDQCHHAGVDIPIVPGIMPITNFTQLARFSDMCGAEIPRWIRWKLDSFGDDMESLRQFGLDVTAKLCQRLLDEGAPGLHIYTMNQHGPTEKLWQRLGLD